jgi:hypothetical protein
MSSELDAIKNVANMAPKKGAIAPIAAAIFGAAVGNKKSKKEYDNEAKLAKYNTDLREYSAQQSHKRDMQKSQQLSNYKAQDSSRTHSQSLEAKRFEADTVHEFATRYSNATEIKHGGTSVKFGKRGSSKPASPTTGSKPKNVKKTNNKKSK